MKSYSILMSAALAACSFTGCGDFLDIKPLNDIVLENFWDEKSDVDQCCPKRFSIKTKKRK